jgi:Tfp pilus assembly protein PilZ
LKLDAERRKHKRYKYKTLISHDVSINGNIHSGKMFDFSKGGLYFESEQVIYPGECIFVALAIHAESPGKDTQLFFDVKILRAKELEDSHHCYGYGGKFIYSHDSFNETGQIKKSEKKASYSDDFRGENDSRKHIRRPYNKYLFFSFDRNEYKGLVFNIGRGGAFILTKENFVLGGKLNLVVPNLKIRKKVKVTGWIVRISPEGIGVSFERRISRERRYDLDRRTGLERRGRKGRKFRSSKR